MIKDEYRHLYRFDYPIDKEALYREKEIMESDETTILHTVNKELLEKVANGREVEGADEIFPKYHDLADEQQWEEIDSWTIRAYGLDKDYNEHDSFSQLHEIKRISEELTRVVGSEGGNSMVPYFLMQEQDTEVPAHIDMGFKCAINIIIDGDQTPIYFRDEDGTITTYNYKAALLNVCGVFHGVPKQKDTKRCILKFRIVDVEYEDALERMRSYFGDT